jgi:hypothetical protein
MELSTESNRVEVNSGLVDAAEIIGEEWDESDENDEDEGEDDEYELTESKDNTLVDMCVKVLGRHLGDVEWFMFRFATSLARDSSFPGANFN